MKNKRQQKIIEIISSEDITTQEMLANKLIEAGFDVTQATVSRDIKDLSLIKTLTKDKVYKYSLHTKSHENMLDPKLIQIINAGIVTIKIAQNIVVLKCYAGMANAVCATIDAMNLKEVAGTLAGDDTIFIAAYTNDDAFSICEQIKNLKD